VSALASFLQMIANLIAQAADHVLGWFSSFSGALWQALGTLVGAVLGWVLDLLVLLVNLLVDLFFTLLGFLVHLLPPVPDPPTWYTDALAPYLGILNTFFPVSEVLTAASAWAAIYAALFLYKGVKFLRGGG